VEFLYIHSSFVPVFAFTLKSAKYGDKVLVVESHIKCGGSAHTFSRFHKGGKYSFEVGPSIFEGLDRPSLNPLRMIFDLLDEKMPVKTYTGLGYWTPTGYWRFPIGSQQKFEDLLMEQAEDGPKAIEVRTLEEKSKVSALIMQQKNKSNQ
jgi:phytoene dehydrogenase-like protein